MERNKFAGGDQAYLRNEQYADSSKLASRANLHEKYGRGDWFPWQARQIGWPEVGDVLEVGCGAGWLWAQAWAEVPAGLRLTLTDYSPGMVDEATRTVQALDHFASVTGRVADAQRLPYADHSFDVVVANHMLYHLPDPALGVGEIARVLRPEGVARIATNGAGHLREIWEMRAEVFPSTRTVDETVDVFGLVSGGALLDDRFDSLVLHDYPDVLRCTEVEDVVAFLCSTPPGDEATGAQVDALRREVRRRFDEGGGVLEISKEVGLFECRVPRGQSRAPRRSAVSAKSGDAEFSRPNQRRAAGRSPARS